MKAGNSVKPCFASASRDDLYTLITFPSFFVVSKFFPHKIISKLIIIKYCFPIALLALGFWGFSPSREGIYFSD
jgi:hypothetical protein